MLLVSTLLLALVHTVISFEEDPHYFVYPNRPEHFDAPKVERRSLLPFLKVRDLPMSGLVYLNRIKPIDQELEESSEEKEENKSIGDEIDTVLQSLKENSSEEEKKLVKKEIAEAIATAAPLLASSPTPPPSLLLSPFPVPQIPFPWQRGFVAPDDKNPLRVRSAPTQLAHQPVVGSAFVQSQFPNYPYYPILPQEQRRDQFSGDELTVVAPSVPLGLPVGQAPSSVQLLPIQQRRLLHAGSPHISNVLPLRAHGVSTHHGRLDDDKLVSISVFRLDH